jgi:prevent-host-death family protein
MNKSNSIKINVVQTRNTIGQIIEDVHYNHRNYIITRRGKPYAKIVPINDNKSNLRKKLLSSIAQDSQKLQAKKINLKKVMDDIRK